MRDQLLSGARPTEDSRLVLVQIANQPRYKLRQCSYFLAARLFLSCAALASPLPAHRTQPLRPLAGSPRRRRRARRPLQRRPRQRPSRCFRCPPSASRLFGSSHEVHWNASHQNTAHIKEPLNPNSRHKYVHNAWYSQSRLRSFFTSSAAPNTMRSVTHGKLITVENQYEPTHCTKSQRSARIHHLASYPMVPPLYRTLPLSRLSPVSNILVRL